MLAKEEILKQIKRGRIKIEPFNEKAIGPVSVDLTLHNEFGIIKSKKIELTENLDYKKYVKLVKADKITLRPNDFILGITKEKITLPDNIAGHLSGRSKFARAGLLVHATAPLIHPGVSNKTVFEIKNISKNTLVINANMRIGQISFYEVKGKAKYDGTFKSQESLK